MAATRIEGFFWVCEDCMHANVNGEEPINRPASEPETWALWEGSIDFDIALATASEGEGEDEDDAEESGEWEFSWHACEGCGSTLAGSRFRFAWFNRH